MSSFRIMVYRAILSRRIVSSVVAAPRVARPAVTPMTWRSYASQKKQESDEEFDARWEAYFNREDIDGWELRKGLNDIYGHDLIPEPKIVIAMLKAARRINDVPMAVRVLEAVKEKAAGDQKIYSYVMDAIKPTLQELGLQTPEELGLT